jgi:UDP-glucose 4-epimerase
MAQRPQLVAVTGAFGMTGRHIIDALTRSSSRCIEVGREQWDLRQWKDTDELDRVFGDAQAIVHVGAAVPSPGQAIPDKDIFDANVRACLCLGEWCLSRDRSLVLISGATVYASPTAIGIIEGAPLVTQPVSGLYGLSKLLAEQVLGTLAARGLRLGILRPSSVYGCGIPATRMVGSFLARAARGQDIVLKPSIDEKINLLHASDLGSAVKRLLDVGAWDIFNIAAAKASSVVEIAQTCVSVVGKGRVVLPIDANDNSGVTRYQLDYSKATAAFGYVPAIELAVGLRQTWLGKLS